MSRIAGTLLFSLGVVSGTSGCQKRNDLAAPDATLSPADSAGAAEFCVAEINRLRATVGVPPLAQSQNVETFSTEAAAVDGAAHEEHKHFHDTNAGGGLVRAENEIPWWDLSNYGSVQTVIKEGLALEWSEGSGGNHYDNMTGRYTQVACGISIRNREVTVTQDFR